MKKRGGKSGGSLYVETALFLDTAAYRTFLNFYQGAGYPNPDIKIRDLMLRKVTHLVINKKFPKVLNVEQKR